MIVNSAFDIYQMDSIFVAILYQRDIKNCKPNLGESVLKQ